MLAAKQTLQQTLGGQNRYVVPVFQRYYSWEKSNWEQLWDDIVEMIDSTEGKHRHFMGALVFVPEKHFTHQLPIYHVIDGQQRMVTLSLLLCALRDVAIEAGFAGLGSEIENTYLVHQFKISEEHFRVYPRQRDRQDYLDAITREKAPTGSTGHVLNYFHDRIAERFESLPEESIRAFYELVVSGLEFVHITLEEDNPYKIFRSLNSKGMDLSEADLIRNFVFMHVLPVAEQDKFDDGSWQPMEDRFEGKDGKLDAGLLSRFFRDYLMRNGQYVGPAATFEFFERTYEQDSFEPRDLVNDLKAYVEFYGIIRGSFSHADSHVESALKKLRELDSSTTYPLLMNLMDRLAKGGINNADLAECIEFLAGFILRRFACGESSRAYGRWFVSACKELEEAPLQNLRSFLLLKGFPGSNRFIEQLTRLNVYDSRYGRSILEYLERGQPYGTNGKPHKEKVDLSPPQIEIEHIMPRTLSEAWKRELGPDAERIYATWLNTVGNLTLSGYNPELYNHAFADKRVEYKKSNISLTRELADIENWTEAEIQKRGHRLAQMASQIWTGPKEEFISSD
jgi:hypothetical protein